MRVPKRASLSRPPRIWRTRLMTCSARSGKCSASHSRNRSLTSHGRRSITYAAEPAPAARAAPRIASSSRSVIIGITGATMMPTGTPALAMASITLSRRAGDGAHGSIARAISASANARLTVTHAPTSRCSSTNRSTSRSTSALLLITPHGLRYSRQTSRQARVSRNFASNG